MKKLQIFIVILLSASIASIKSGSTTLNDKSKPTPPVASATVVPQTDKTKIVAPSTPATDAAKAVSTPAVNEHAAVQRKGLLASIKEYFANLRHRASNLFKRQHAGVDHVDVAKKEPSMWERAKEEARRLTEDIKAPFTKHTDTTKTEVKQTLPADKPAVTQSTPAVSTPAVTQEPVLPQPPATKPDVPTKPQSV